MYIDIHTHKLGLSGISIYNVLANENNVDFTFFNYFSIGIHPWYAIKSFENSWQNILDALKSEKCLAIGEIGLDRLHGADWNLQIHLLEKQILLAIEFQKPIIFHSVKSYSDIAQILNKLKPKVPLIFHDFNGNIEMIRMFKKFDAYFSFGKSLLHSKSKASEVFPFISPQFIFFETDDFEINIKEIYLQAEKISHLTLNQWMNQINYNFSKVFKSKR